MIRNYALTAWRNLRKHPFFTFVNIGGLALGLMVTFFIISYISLEFSYDLFHSKKDRIYRVESRFYEGDQLTDDWATSTFGYGSAMKKEIPGIEDFVRISIHETEQVVRYNETKRRENGIVYTEPSFFRIFDFRLLEGDTATALSKPNSVVITQSVARGLFGSGPALGKMLRFSIAERFVDCRVTGVLADFPSNSHINFRYLLAYEGLPLWMKDFWYMHEAYTYILLKPGVSPKEIEKAFPALAEKYKTSESLRSKKWAISLSRLADIHLNQQKAYEPEIKGNKTTLYPLLLVAMVILIMAWINYINLSTIRYLERAKEVAIRKVSGARPTQLIGQFLMESAIINLAAILLAAILIWITHSLFNNLIGRPIDLSYFFIRPALSIPYLGLVILGIFLSGYYPAFILSAIKPALILKGNYAHSGSGKWIQNTLVIFQFSAALFLMTCLFIVQKQIRFMEGQNLGVQIEKTIAIKYPVSTLSNLATSVKLFSEKLKTLPGVQAATVGGAIPGMEVAKFASNRLYGGTQNQARLYEMLTVDYDYLETFGLQMAAGRAFKKGFGDEINDILVNEACLPQLGFLKPEEAIGHKVLLEGEKEPSLIIGVVKNWHQRGLEKRYTPIMFILNGRISWVPPQFITVKIKGENLTANLAIIKREWSSYFPESSFDSFFLEDYFNEQYLADIRFNQVIQFFTGLAFFITMLGVWALASYTARKRVREIGIRRVFGAGGMHLWLLFSKGITQLVVISFLLAVPFSYLAMTHWLGRFAFRTNIDAGIYVIGGLVALGIIGIIALCQSMLVTLQKPIRSLRSE